LLQKFPSDNFTATAKLTFHTSTAIDGERTGLVIMGMDYGMLSLEKTKDGFILYQIECLQAEKRGKEIVNEKRTLTDSTLYLRVHVSSEARCIFSYSLEGKSFKTLGKPFTAKEGKWIGAKMGFFCSRPVRNNDGGRVEIDWFKVE
jgi:hypothetical protein